MLGRLVGDPEQRIADRELGDDLLVLVGAADAVDLDGAERRRVELDGGAAAPHRELGLEHPAIMIHARPGDYSPRP
ncbi:MAG: hypothetical protein ACRDMZ_11675 [Solirubrobacteraceae bacterium]